jgi:AraC-like DNA-binding protein
MHLIRTGALTGYTALVSKLGHNPILLLQQVGLTPGQLHNPNTYVSYQKIADLLDITAEQCHDPMFGLRLASSHSAIVMGELAFGIGMQPTLGDSLRYAKTHLALHAQGAHLEEQILGELTRWCFYLDFTNDWGLRQLIQLSIGHLCIGLANNDAPDRRVSIHLQQAEPAHYEKVSGYQKLLVFGSDFDGVQFPTVFSNHKVSQDPDILRDYFQQRIQMLEQLYPSSVPSQLKYLFTSALARGDCSLPQVAASLNLHPRVLQKKLHAEGTSFSKLLQETRQDIACQHLRESNIGITDLALKLGYAEVAIFSRYFKRWTGLSPQLWRRLHANRAD